jgi:hypothetical protein
MANEFLTKKVVKATFNPSTNLSQRVIATHGLGVIIPAGAIITNTMYDCPTTFTSATDAATISFGLTSAATAFKAATAISTGTTYDDVTNLVAGTPISAATAVKTTTNQEVIAVVAVEALTAGKIDWYIEYYI